MTPAEQFVQIFGNLTAERVFDWDAHGRLVEAENIYTDARFGEPEYWTLETVIALACSERSRAVH